MFVLSWKHSRGKTIAIIAVVAAAATCVWALAVHHAAAPKAECAGKSYSLSAATNEERVAFFKQFGWEVAGEPIDAGEVTIPETFNEVYLNYNNIQKEQGLDLQPYAGHTVQQWIYRVTNYPQQKTMRGTVLVSGGKVIGGDLCTPELDGFMTGFDGQIRGGSCCTDSFSPARTSTGELTNAASSSSAVKTAASAEDAKKPVSSAVPANAWPTD